MSIAKYIDYTLLKAQATSDDIKKLCDEAIEYGFASVCVNPCWVHDCKRYLEGSKVKICTVVGYPLGANDPSIKMKEAQTAIALGADEIDMVINIGMLKSGMIVSVMGEIIMVRSTSTDVILKVIIETCLLTDNEKIEACKLAKSAGADFIKTSTGMSTSGATCEDVALIREAVGPEMGVKASGGISTFIEATNMLMAGATRIGASKSVGIIKEQEESEKIEIKLSQ